MQLAINFAATVAATVAAIVTNALRAPFDAAMALEALWAKYALGAGSTEWRKRESIARTFADCISASEPIRTNDSAR